MAHTGVLAHECFQRRQRRGCGETWDCARLRALAGARAVTATVLLAVVVTIVVVTIVVVAIVVPVVVLVFVPAMVVDHRGATAFPGAVKEALPIMMRSHPVCAFVRWTGPVSVVPLIVAAHRVTSSPLPRYSPRPDCVAEP